MSNNSNNFLQGQLVKNVLDPSGNLLPPRTQFQIVPSNSSVSVTSYDDPVTGTTVIGITSLNSGPAGVTYGPYASRPSSAAAGSVYVPSDGPVSYVYSGSAWLPMLPGAGTPLHGAEVAPSNVNPFTFESGGVSVLKATFGGCVSIGADNATGTGANSTAVNGYAKACNFGANGDYAAAWLKGASAGSSGYSFYGIYLKDTTSGALYAFGISTSPGNSGGTTQATWLTVVKYDSLTSQNGYALNDVCWSIGHAPIGLRIRRDASEIYFEFSIDGTTWLQVYRVAVASSFVPIGTNTAGFMIDPYNMWVNATALAWGNT